jgi:lipid A 3-O-deacylase
MIRKFLPVSALACACSAAAGDGTASWETKWSLGDGWALGGYWEFSVGGWQDKERVSAIGAMPVFRIERTYGSVVPYLDGAVGLNLLSQVDATGRVAASRLERADHLGAGLRFGEQRRHELGLRLQHLSDGGVARPSPGMVFGQVRYQYNFE